MGARQGYARNGSDAGWRSRPHFRPREQMFVGLSVSHMYGSWFGARIKFDLTEIASWWDVD
jgi:hypothetical protein